MSSDIVSDTGIRFSVSPRTIFNRASRAKGWSNWQEVANHRYERYISHSEVPEWISDYCLSLWAEVLRSAQQGADGNAFV
jgi:hypothetical protein